MNDYEIDRALQRHQGHPVLENATQFLAAFRDEVNAHSDGWAYWPKPVRAADKLMTLIEHPETATPATYKQALVPIKTFYTKHGDKAGMKRLTPEGRIAMGAEPTATVETVHGPEYRAAMAEIARLLYALDLSDKDQWPLVEKAHQIAAKYKA